MKKTTFEMVLIVISAPLTGIGLAMLLNGAVGGSFILLGASLKLIVAYFRTPKEMFDYSEIALALTISKKECKRFKTN